MKVKIIKESKQISEVEEALPNAPTKLQQVIEKINQLRPAQKDRVIEAIGGVTREQYENLLANYHAEQERYRMYVKRSQELRGVEDSERLGSGGRGSEKTLR